MHESGTFRMGPHTDSGGHAHDGCTCVLLLEGKLRGTGRAHVADGRPGTLRVSAAARHDIDFGPAGCPLPLVEADRGRRLAVLHRLERPRFVEADGWLRDVVHASSPSVRPPDPARHIVLDGLVVELLAQLERMFDGRLNAAAILVGSRAGAAARGSGRRDGVGPGQGRRGAPRPPGARLSRSLRRPGDGVRAARASRARPPAVGHDHPAAHAGGGLGGLRGSEPSHPGHADRVRGHPWRHTTRKVTSVQDRLSPAGIEFGRHVIGPRTGALAHHDEDL